LEHHYPELSITELKPGCLNVGDALVRQT